MDSKRQVSIIVGYTIIFSLLFIIGMVGGTKLDKSTDWKPIWYFPFIFTSFVITVPLLIIPIIYTSLQIYQKMEINKFKKRWILFLIGVSIYAITWIGTTITNFLAQKLIRDLWAIISLISFLMTYAIYYGVGKKIE